MIRGFKNIIIINNSSAVNKIKMASKINLYPYNLYVNDVYEELDAV